MRVCVCVTYLKRYRQSFLCKNDVISDHWKLSKRIALIHGKFLNFEKTDKGLMKYV